MTYRRLRSFLSLRQPAQKELLHHPGDLVRCCRDYDQSLTSLSLGYLERHFRFNPGAALLPASSPADPRY